MTASNYTLTVYYNPQGETYTTGTNNDAPATTTIALTVNAQKYDLTVSAETGGTVSGTTSGSYVAGHSASVTVVAESGYHFVNWTASGVTLTSATANPAAFTMPAGAVTLTANFAQDVTTVTSVAVSPSTANVRQGTTQQFAATVNSTNNSATTVTWSVSGGTGSTNIDSIRSLPRQRATERRQRKLSL